MIIRWSSPINLLKACFRALHFLFSGRPVLAPPEVQAERHAICLKCPLRLDDQCTVCTCFTNVKVMLSAESCPDHPARWKKLTFSKPIPKHAD